MCPRALHLATGGVLGQEACERFELNRPARDRNNRYVFGVEHGIEVAAGGSEDFDGLPGVFRHIGIGLERLHFSRAMNCVWFEGHDVRPNEAQLVIAD
jgi:hypothetical protein